MNKDDLFDILNDLLDSSKILHSDNFSIIDKKIYSKSLNDFVNANQITYLNFAELFLSTNTRLGLINALNLSLKTIGDDINIQKKLIKSCIENINKSDEFKDIEKYMMTNLVQDKFPNLF